PAATQQPAAGLHAAERLADARERLVERLRVLEPHLTLRHRPRWKVDVRVREPGHDAAAAEVDALRGRKRRLVRADAAGDPFAGAGALLGGALAAWIFTFVRMRGMDAAPGTELGGLGWYLGIWVTMTAAMMLPATAPMVVVFSRVSRERARHRSGPAAPTWVF